MSVLKGEGRVPILFGSTRTSRGGVDRPVYLARPDLTGEWPTVIVAPSTYGLTSSVKDLARRLARHGLAALAVDPYRGRRPERSASPEEAAAAFDRHARPGLARIVADVATFAANPAAFWSNAARGYGVLAIGGGTAALAQSGAVPRPAAAVLAAPDSPPATVPALPLLALVGTQEADEVAVGALRAALPAAEFVLYSGASGEFLDDSLPAYDAAVAADALERMVEFFEKHLPPGPAG